jgi:pimeloyl-ACP methyl ester carboxylesterase
VLPARHPLAGEQAIPLGSLGEETFVFFARELAPRLRDALVGLCRRAGFEPKVRSGSFHTGWDLGILSQAGGVRHRLERPGIVASPRMRSVRATSPPRRITASCRTTGACRPLSSITVPALVIRGTADPMFPLGHCVALAEEIPDASLLVLEGAGHGVGRADWEAIAAAILVHTESDEARR